jgi:hypothetical protein
MRFFFINLRTPARDPTRGALPHRLRRHTGGRGALRHVPARVVIEVLYQKALSIGRVFVLAVEVQAVMMQAMASTWRAGWVPRRCTGQS